MARAKRKEQLLVDPFGSVPKNPADAAAAQVQQGKNILDSYARAADLLAEALQNATDAIDARTRVDPKAPRRIEIVFDARSRRFSVTDTGTGMNPEDLQIVLTPNVTLKSGPTARPQMRRSRGQKGVGLSFLALASNYLRIETCDGNEHSELTLEGGFAWVSSRGKNPRPQGEIQVTPARRQHGSTTYTTVTVGDIAPEHLDDLLEVSLFDKKDIELEHLLRTETAIGFTKPLFRERFGEVRANENIDVDLIYVTTAGKRSKARRIPYLYMTPEELVPERVIDYERLSGRTAKELARRTRGKAVRYRFTRKSRAGHVINSYLFVTDAADFNEVLEQKKKELFFPSDWQGFFVATRGMPTGIRFPPRYIQPRAYERRIFAIFEDDDLALDLGRKTLAPRQLSMMQEAVQEMWDRDLRVLVPRVGSSGADASTSEALFKSRVKRALQRPELPPSVKYLRDPATLPGAVALFYELVGGGELVGDLRTVTTGVFTKDRDAAVFEGAPNGSDPVHVLFGFTLDEVIDELEGESGLGYTAGLVVVWQTTLTSAPAGVIVEERRRVKDGITHDLLLGGLAGHDTLPIIELRSLLHAE